MTRRECADAARAMPVRIGPVPSLAIHFARSADDQEQSEPHSSEDRPQRVAHALVAQTGVVIPEVLIATKRHAQLEEEHCYGEQERGEDEMPARLAGPTLACAAHAPPIPAAKTSRRNRPAAA